ncbi:MAG: pyridoxamine 5'-phosphate oxidase family protein [Lachnospiraceae bacterium]|nr:pyridoxamine 5'-phosphate oxidase family protein [Lachnospiraceae bacterium]
MNAITEELKKTGTFYVATVEGDQPRVRPFGAVTEFEGKTYICTNNTKACYAQMLANPKTEICGMQPDGSWVRISGNLVRDDRDEARAAMLADNPGLGMMYHVGDGIFEVLYIADAKGTKSSFTAPPVVLA